MRDLSVKKEEVMSLSLLSFANVEKSVWVLKELKGMSFKQRLEWAFMIAELEIVTMSLYAFVVLRVHTVVVLMDNMLCFKLKFNYYNNLITIYYNNIFFITTYNYFQSKVSSEVKKKKIKHLFF